MSFFLSSHLVSFVSNTYKSSSRPRILMHSIPNPGPRKIAHTLGKKARLLPVRRRYDLFLSSFWVVGCWNVGRWKPIEERFSLPSWCLGRGRRRSFGGRVWIPRWMRCRLPNWVVAWLGWMGLDFYYSSLLYRGLQSPCSKVHCPICHMLATSYDFCQIEIQAIIC